MNSNHSSPVSLSLEGAAGPEVVAPTRFARALKRARMARGWTQAELAKRISLTKRAIVSWETAERIPSIGMVVLLLDVLIPEDDLSLHRELTTAYVADDLEQQGSRKEPGSPFVRRVQRVLERVLQLPIRDMSALPGTRRIAEEEALDTPEETCEPPQKAGSLEPLFALMERLHQHPDLIPVANDFVRELAPDR
jgi:transcriptional regulator with XRE-family HTH domain